MDEPFPLSPGNAPAPAPAGPGGTAPHSSQGHVGGPRHYAGPTLGQLIMWKCVACGSENTGKLEDGCSSCGSGSVKPYHVDAISSTSSLNALLQVKLWKAPLENMNEDPFDQWLRDRFREEAPAMMKLRPILFEAWKAAIKWYTQRGSAAEPAWMVTPLDIELPAATVIPTVLMPRSLIRRVIETLEQTFDLPEDQQSPELIALIAELKELSE